MSDSTRSATTRVSRPASFWDGFWIGLVIAVVAVVWGYVVVSATDAFASPLDCEGIKDADGRHYCRAVSIPDRLECELIRNGALRSQCRASVR